MITLLLSSALLLLPAHIQLVTGVESQFNGGLTVLKGRKETVFPDIDGY